MSDTFRKLCVDGYRDTQFLHDLKDCFPHYQRVLDYIITHPEQRDEMAAALSGSFYNKPGAAVAEIYVLQFLMQSLKWPEIREAAEMRWNDGGNSVPGIKDLLEVYRAA
jgi:hypothetical protein